MLQKLQNLCNVSAAQDAGREAAFHAMRDKFANADTDAILLFDAAEAFNSINPKVMLHNLKFICPITAAYAMQLHQGYILLMEERYFLLRGKLKATQ